MNNCVECTFNRGWRGHREGVTVELTPSRALELHGNKVVAITSTGQTVLSELGFAVPKSAKPKPKAATRSTKPKATPKVESESTVKVEPAATNKPQLESGDK